ncbi:glycoside hydrolase family 3 C-terminal domain-containing protein [Sphingomonas sabuli]|uniref:Glycoside hydrolase family 3 C-terminal domain-containing protein n=1 Tax=Sphingomonas sabuli TaxID=2764186 RepID=A0A7G9KZA7_9SPHN|nr:glycoside hydrolase family 3 protein [Sphingomonas sabuli]QNM81706.1 glycoside hydrolase family 3 C-terminal domain-containing protein [Sphingomonas sabuli]
MSIGKSAALALLLATAGCSTTAPPPVAVVPAPVDAPAPVEAAAPAPTQAGVANPAAWPIAKSPAAITDAATEAKITALLQRMTVEQKVGQVIQGDISTINPSDLAAYPVGSILAGGNSGPYGNERASGADWAKLAAAFDAASRSAGAGVPVLFGIDAVHGHANVPSATVFPHNVGLGATHDTDLLRRIGEVTALEIGATGIPWTFAPTLAVPQDVRWGRAYEGYSSDPALVAAYSTAMVEGLQGKLISGQALAVDKVAATAKHFLADGGTADGKDQGDAKGSEAELVRIHAAGYKPAIDAGVLTVMVSFSSWQGVKHHGNKSLLTDVLRGPLGFEGLTVGDWNGHGQIPGCTTTDCPQALLAGLDLYMAPDSWKGLFDSTLAHVRDGTIPMARLEEAARRVIRVKYKLGLMDAQPVVRTNAANLGAPAHLALAREAAAKSLVLLKNQDSALPIRAGARVLVTGPGADSMAMQSGGWTISWQGSDVTKADFPNGQTVGGGIVAAVREAGGTAAMSADGSYRAKPDVAVVVFGEEPYAEFQGDRPNLDYTGEGLATIAKLKAAGIPVVSVFLSGRPMFVGPELAASDAFVAAWWPGSQGAGIADVLVSRRNGRPAREFSGTLSFAWPAGCEPGAATLFPLGFGGTYAQAPAVPALNTECALSKVSDEPGYVLFDRGLRQGVFATGGDTNLVDLAGAATNLNVTPFDIETQEDARRISWTGPMDLHFKVEPRDLPAGSALEMRYKVDNAPTAPVVLSAYCDGCEKVDLQSTFALAAGKGWRTSQVPLKCFATGKFPRLTIRSNGPFVLELQTLRIVPTSAQDTCTGPF